MDKLTELKRLAEAVIEGKDAFMRLPRAERLEGVPSWWRDHRAYADAMSPQTALSLIAQIEHLTAEREKDREALEVAKDACSWAEKALERYDNALGVNVDEAALVAWEKCGSVVRIVRNRLEERNG